MIQPEDEPIVIDDPIHHHFGLSYANYLVVPRSILQSMPAAWQAGFVTLLDQLEERYGDRLGRLRYNVVARFPGSGRIVRDDLADYERGRRYVEPDTGS